MSSIFPLIKGNLFEHVWSVVTFESIINVYWEGRKIAGKEGSARSNCGCNTPTLQTLGKEEKVANKRLIKNHQKAQLQPQDPNPAKSNQTTINNIQPIKKQATTSPLVIMQFQSRLQNPKRVNCNNMNRKTRTTKIGK
jgi:hypothetical protein